MARVVIPGWPHHVSQRGNHRQTVFHGDLDHEIYLHLLEKYLRSYHAELIGYCLMGNHVHLIAIPDNPTSLSKGIGRANNDYSRWQNIRLDRVGHLWQARFYSCPVEIEEIWKVLAYVELNPVRAKLVKKPQDWKWSSACAHLTGMNETGLLNMELWDVLFSPLSWTAFLQQRQNEMEFLQEIRTATESGRPIAGPETIKGLERQLNRTLRPQRRGPKGNPPQSATF
jgi:putative transposase